MTGQARVILLARTEPRAVTRSSDAQPRLGLFTSRVRGGPPGR
ncbi:hypothetical protein ACQPZQ_37130 [Pseudonocardia sp. CA-142604]